MAPRVSVVVPALNEALALPRLLKSLAAQTLRPVEVIVADSNSVDDTVALARQAGARVVAGGPPAVGRNAGASVATGELLLFLDADTQPARTFIAQAVAEFTRRRLDVATAALRPIERGAGLLVGAWVTEAYLRAIWRREPRAVGACILVRKAFHDELGGFDESLRLAEDHDYVRRASEQGRFGLLNNVRIPVSMRRVAAAGTYTYAKVLVSSEVKTLAGKPVHRLPKGYQLGGPTDDVDADAPADADPRGRWRALARPDTETQGDLIGVVSAAGGRAALRAGTGSRRLRPVAAAAGAVAAAAAGVALLPVRQERRFGRFFSATVGVSRREGEGVVCELHAVHGLRTMAALRRQGRAGRLQARLEVIEGLRDLRLAFGDARYRDVRVMKARADIARALLRVGFVEVPPPPLSLANRLEKRLLAVRVGSVDPRGAPRPDCLVVMSRKDWERPETLAAIETWLAAMRAELATLQSGR